MPLIAVHSLLGLTAPSPLRMSYGSLHVQLGLWRVHRTVLLRLQRALQCWKVNHLKPVHQLGCRLVLLTRVPPDKKRERTLSILCPRQLCLYSQKQGDWVYANSKKIRTQCNKLLLRTPSVAKERYSLSPLDTEWNPAWLKQGLKIILS